MGGRSPLLENTYAQAKSIEKKLKNERKLKNKRVFKVFVSMRYWHPFFKETLQDISEFNPDEILLLPLYPQFSTTTTASSLKEALEILKKTNIPIKSICCYPTLTGFIDGIFDLTQDILKKLTKERTSARILYVAHGLPLSIVKSGDPYPEQLLLSVAALTSKIDTSFQDGLFSFDLCYQSKVGPLPWLKPSLGEELQRASLEKIGVIIIPISFVSEHSETLVELDLEYLAVANSLNLPFYIRIPTVSCHPKFVEGLKDMILKKTSQENPSQKTSTCLCSKFVINCK